MRNHQKGLQCRIPRAAYGLSYRRPGESTNQKVNLAGMEGRHWITGLLLAMGVFIAYQFVISKVYPPSPPPPPASIPPAVVETAPGAPPTELSTQPVTTTPSVPQLQPASIPVAGPNLFFEGGEDRKPVTLGGGTDDALELTLSPRGAGIESIRITERDDKGKYRYLAKARGEDPYQILEPMEGGSPQLSFTTHEIQVVEYGDRRWGLDELTWRRDEAASSESKVVFTTMLRDEASGAGLLHLRKTFDLQTGQPLINMQLAIENASDRQLTIVVVQDGATGISRESPMYEMRRLIAAHYENQVVETSKAVQRQQLRNKAGQATPVSMFVGDPQKSFAWVALANRFFGVFIRPLPDSEGKLTAVASVKGSIGLPASDAKLGDMVGRMWSPRLSLAAGKQLTQSYEIYAGPKDPDILETVNPDFVDNTKVYYNLAQAADQRCCTFEPLPQIMVGLLHGIHYVVRNYGIAIIIMVIIVRALLHKLTVFQQKSMYRMQDAMARLQPKMQAIKERHANDKAKQNQELMKLYAEEGVNPMGSLVGMLPLFIQMPILVALWTGLNTDIQLRHAAFDGWWIKDLAAPDALIPFNPPFDIPILGQFPLLGWMFCGITAFNLLPVLMGVSMWLQQKYMPKPGMQAKLDAAKTSPPKDRKPGQMTPQDQMRQQQMIGYMMTFMFPLMFYYMPSGLNLYWMSTNVFGIFESLIIRKQIKEEKERRDREGPQPPKKKKVGLVGRMLKHMASQAEGLQKRADVLSEQRKAPPRPDQDHKQKKR
ncbi:MAG: YidC/Oxa1 family insertase periplasmic-domain containing protein [Planctomycetota bacterium]